MMKLFLLNLTLFYCYNNNMFMLSFLLKLFIYEVTFTFIFDTCLSADNKP